MLHSQKTTTILKLHVLKLAQVTPFVGSWKFPHGDGKRRKIRKSDAYPCHQQVKLPAFKQTSANVKVKKKPHQTTTKTNEQQQNKQTNKQKHKKTNQTPQSFMISLGDKKNPTSVYFSPPYISLQYWQYPNTDCTVQRQLTTTGACSFSLACNE